MTVTSAPTAISSAPPRQRYIPVVGPRLKRVLMIAFGLFVVLVVNSVYLVSITLLEWLTKQTYQNYFYQFMFLLHLVAGLAIIVPVVAFGLIHMRNAHNRPNQRAKRAGYALFFVSLLLLATGLVLMRFDVFGFRFEIKDAGVRRASYWIHVIAPLIACWLFVLHRLAGRRIKWKVGAAWATVAVGFACVMAALQAQDPRRWYVEGPKSGEQYFFPSLARTATGNFIPERAMLNDGYCKQCHADIHENWAHSMHRFSSFNNPAYLFSVLETRKVIHERDGKVNAARWCAGCHDPVPFFSGAFDDAKFDDPNYDLASDSLAQAGITCTVCHAITNINSVRGNADYTIEEPMHYPFAYSPNPFLQWVNRQLVKAKPDFHKKTFLKPHHKTAEFCSTCHKVHLPPELNHYKWLRGQNHYDAFLLSGVSGHGIQAWYYPPKAETNCNGCHMPTMASNDFGAKRYDDSGVPKVHDHQFPSANTAIPHLLNMPEWVNEKHRDFNKGVMRVDIFGVKEGGTINGKLHAPLRPEAPALRAGASYLLETVIRTVKMGHLFTQGTVDSNEVWLDVTVRNGDRVIGRSGGLREDGQVDPYSHFVNVYMLDRHGKRIDRRNAQDIFFPLYNHQVPPGAGEVVHYRLDLPENVTGPVTVDVKLQYRKFDTIYMKHFQAEKFVKNDLPILTLAADTVIFAVQAADGSPATAVENPTPEFPLWQRWNDYGIGLFRKGDLGSDKGELRQAEMAFAEVEKLKRPDGPLNRARVYIKEGRLEEAVAALRQAAEFDPPAYPWQIAYYTGIVNKQNGYLDEAIENFRSVVLMRNELTQERGFDFSRDYTLLNELGQTLFERAKLERGEDRVAQRDALLKEAIHWFERALSIDSESMEAHFNLALIYARLGDKEKSNHHRALHAKYKPDDNARDSAIAVARRENPAADQAAEAIVIYDLQREGAYELSPREANVARAE